jgi:hypothetical protein
MNGAHAACDIKIIDLLSKPNGYALGEIQLWIKQDNNFSGRKAVLSDELTQEAMQWWSTHTYGNGRIKDCKKVQTELKSYLSTYARKQYSLFQNIIFYLFISSVVSIVAKMIVTWLFENREAHKTVYANRGIYFVEPIVPYKAGM